MKVRITAKGGYANPRRNLELQYYDVVALDEELAHKLIRLGIAEPAPVEKKPAAKVETTEAAAPRNAALRTTKPKSRTVKPE